MLTLSRGSHLVTRISRVFLLPGTVPAPAAGWPRPSPPGSPTGPAAHPDPYLPLGPDHEGLRAVWVFVARVRASPHLLRHHPQTKPGHCVQKQISTVDYSVFFPMQMSGQIKFLVLQNSGNDFLEILVTNWQESQHRFCSFCTFFSHLELKPPQHHPPPIAAAVNGQEKLTLKPDVLLILVLLPCQVNSRGVENPCLSS